MEHLLEIKDVTRVYEGGVLASHNVDFIVDEGEIHALMGKDGAGKSTPMKTLCGLEGIISDHICLNGKEPKLQSSKETIEHGIDMMHQHFTLVDLLTGAESMMLGLEKIGFMPNKRQDILITDETAKKHNFKIDALGGVRDMSVGMRQKLEISKILHRSVKLIILDEPTAVFTSQETEELSERLMKLKERGMTIIFISRKLNEVKRISDRIIVLKGDVTKGVCLTEDMSKEDIPSLTVRREISFEYDKARMEVGKVVLKVQDLVYADRFKIPKFSGVSMEVGKGEIMGTAGVEGDRQSELIFIITNDIRALEGRIFLNGQGITNEPVTNIRKISISHVPEDHIIEGCTPEMSLQENLVVPSTDTFTSKSGMMENARVKEHCREQIHEFMIKVKDESQSIGSLSGGSIQKAIVVRGLVAPSDLLVSNQSTRGVGVGAISFIHSKILEVRSHNETVLLFSADLNGPTSLSDRVLVMHKGKIVGALSNTPKVTEQELELYMLGLKKQKGLGQIMGNESQNRKPFDIMDYFSVMRIAAAPLSSILLVFVIIFFINQTPGLVTQELIPGPLEIKRSSFSVVVRAIPLIFTGPGLTLCLKSSVFNISSDAPFYMGVAVVAAIAITYLLLNGLHQLALILAAAVVGGVVFVLPITVDKYTKINPVALTIMADSIFYYSGLSTISSFFLKKNGSWGSYKFPGHAKLGTMIKGATLHYGFIIVITVTLLVIFLVNKTSFGYKVQATGNNPAFARASGIRTGSVTPMTWFVGGAIAGMGGAIKIMGAYRRFQWQSQTVYVQGRLPIYMSANGNLTFIPLAIFFIACLRVGAEIMSRSTDLNPEIVTFLQEIIILLVTSQRFLYFLKQRHNQKMSPKQVEAGEGGTAA